MEEYGSQKELTAISKVYHENIIWAKQVEFVVTPSGKRMNVVKTTDNPSYEDAETASSDKPFRNVIKKECIEE